MTSILTSDCPCDLNTDLLVTSVLTCLWLQRGELGDQLQRGPGLDPEAAAGHVCPARARLPGHAPRGGRGQHPAAARHPLRPRVQRSLRAGP